VFDIEHDGKWKKTRKKARLVVQGFNQFRGRYFDKTWAPVPNMATSRARFSEAAANGGEVHHIDFKSSFLNDKMDKEMYTKLPDGVESEEPTDVRRLNLVLYRTKQAGRLWGITLKEEL